MSERRKKRRQSQPRIKGLRRLPAWTALHPNVRAGIERIALEENKSRSYVVAEFLSKACGVNVLTGKLLPRLHVVKLRRTA